MHRTRAWSVRRNREIVAVSEDPVNCEEVLAHLADYLDRELDGPFSARVEHHLERCRGCFSRAEFERRLKALVRESADRPASERLRARVAELIGRY
jgi:anti-sigma factor (TIGR02949 family)